MLESGCDYFANSAMFMIYTFIVDEEEMTVEQRIEQLRGDHQETLVSLLAISHISGYLLQGAVHRVFKSLVVQ